MRTGWRGVLVLCLVLGVARLARDPVAAPSPALAGEPPAATGPADRAGIDVPALLKQLGSDEWQVRQRAEATLVRLGDRAVPHLERLARDAVDDEVRSRCDAALRRIAEERVTGPTLVTLKLAGASPRDCYKALAEAARVELRPHPPTLWDTGVWPAVTLDVVERPFWEVARELAERSGAALRYVNEELHVARPTMNPRVGGGAAGGGAALGLGVGTDTPTCVSGPFVVLATRLSRSREIDLERDVEHGAFTVGLAVLAEPKVRVLQALPAFVDEAADDRGNSLLLEPARVNRSNGGAVAGTPRGNAWYGTAALKPPARGQGGERIATLKGSIRVVLQTRSDVAEVADLLAASDLAGSVADVPFTVRDFRRTGPGEQYELTMSVSRGGASQEDWDRLRQRVAAHPVKIFDPEGRLMASRGTTQNVVNEHLELTTRLSRDRPRGVRDEVPAVGADAKAERDAPRTFRLVWEIPVESKTVTVPFAFSDLPMP